MSQNVKNFVQEQVKALLEAPSCCAEAKEAGQNWLDAIGTDREAECARLLVQELEEDIVTIDDLMAFAGSEDGVQTFGEETAKDILTKAQEAKTAGAQYCFCPACAACEAILEKKDEFLNA